MLIPERRTFTTESHVDAARLVRRWEQHNADSLIELACEVPGGLHFRAREVNVNLEQVRFALVSGTAHSVARDEELIAARPGEAIAVYAALRGEALLECDGRRQVVRPGQLLVCDVDRPFLRGFGHGLMEFAVRIPRRTFTDYTGLEGLVSPLVIDSDANQFARALMRLVGRAVNAAVPTPVDEQAVLELVSVLATPGETPASAAHRAAARIYVDDHLTDPGLSAGDVAHGTGLSERHLSRLFAQAGTSVPRHVLARRLDLAYALLAHGDAQRTSDAAQRCGFTSTAYFSQSFKQRFAVTAGEVLRLGRGVERGSQFSQETLPAASRGRR
ncbi:helix-turn-helix domain-containing protein [Nocardioides daejeonensis]|uniref:helix-turn-helix domain-containing protein n=1 Tax=Nocardioides daejeonensis TaxID=1046556 RepID=UPI000D749456